VSAGEGEKFAQVVTSVTEDIRRLGPATRLVRTSASAGAEV
jgi:coenzyme F420-reducing hydrogenase delta subunit